jgi:alpha-D-ribose 1-methylphosphonate 5-triphosphate synthase subunit PhnL
MTAMLQTADLGKSFLLHLQGGLHIPVLEHVDLAVAAGECVALVGASGAGKSTLLRSLYGNYRANAGSILIHHDGRMIDIAQASPRDIVKVRADTLGYVSQFLRVVPRVAAIDIVAEAARDMNRESALDQARALLLRLNIPARLHALPPATSSASTSRVASLAAIRSCCWTNPRPRSITPTATSSST